MPAHIDSRSVVAASQWCVRTGKDDVHAQPLGLRVAKRHFKISDIALLSKKRMTKVSRNGTGGPLSFRADGLKLKLLSVARMNDMGWLVKP